MKKQILLLCTILLLVACSSGKENYEGMSAEQIYNKAYEDLEATRYKKAYEAFEKLETEHPYSQWAVKSKLMGAYAYYKDEKYDDAIMALDRFIKYHPGNKDVAYAYYMKGICYYDQIASADKDQGNTENAERAFERLIMLFPDSEYAADARNKIKLTQDYKAGQEMIVGRYYLKDGNYLSALNRFNVVLENYQTTIQIEEALYREVEIYAIFGMPKYAKGYYNILKKNYPDGTWTKKAAAIMKKISNDNEANSSVAVQDKNDKSWFHWFNFGDKDEQTNVNTINDEKADKNLLDRIKFWKNDEDSTAVNQVESETLLSRFNWLNGKAETNQDDTAIKTETGDIIANTKEGK